MTQNHRYTELRFAPQLENHLPAVLLATSINKENQATATQPSIIQCTENNAVGSDDAEYCERDNKSNCASPVDKFQSASHTCAQNCYQHEINGTVSCSAVQNKTPLVPQHAVSERLIFIRTSETNVKMGNRQSENKESGNETPEEQTPSCCKTPKRKAKGKPGKHLPIRRDDTEFDSGEVYPFDAKCKEESEIVEPVDLDPFEIVETDDLSFIAGAGTSGVILSGANGQYRISREIILEEKENDEALSTEHETGKGFGTEPDDSGNENQTRSAKKSDSEFGHVTDTYSSTTRFVRPFESSNNDKQETGKVEKQQELSLSSVNKSKDTHSRIILLSQDMFSETRYEKEQSTEKPDIENDLKRKSDIEQTTTSKENNSDKTLDTEMLVEESDCSPPGTDKKLEQSKYKTEDNVVYENLNPTDVEKIIAKQAPLETIVPVKYILTQEMFKTKSLISNEKEQQEHVGNAPLASMEDTNLSEFNADTNNDLKHIFEEKIRVITHENDSTRNNDIVNISNPTYGYNNDDDSVISGTQEENVYETVDVKVNRYSDKQGQCSHYEHISVVNKKETDVQTDLPELPKTSLGSVLPDITRTTVNYQGETDKSDIENHSLASANGHLKLSQEYEPNEKLAISNKPADSPSVSETFHSNNISIDGSSEGNKDQQNLLGLLKSSILSKTDSLEVPSRDGSVAISREDTVPPPSPASMNILTEENEEEDDETEHTKSNEIVEFGDVVCKRLSKLLEEKTFQDEDTATTNVDQDSIIYFSPREFVDTSTGRYEMEDVEAYNEGKETYPENKNINALTSVSKNNPSDQQISSDGMSLPSLECSHLQNAEVERLAIKRNDSAETLKRASGDSTKYDVSQYSGSSSDDLPDFFDPENIHDRSNKAATSQKEGSKLSLSLQDFDDTIVQTTPNSSFVDDLTDVTPIAGVSGEFTALPELAKTVDKSVVQHEHTDQATGRRSITGTESDLDISEQRTNVSTDSMYADDEAEETMDILFTKTYTEPIEGAEVFLSCTVVNSAFKDEAKKREVWLSSDEALEYFEANASEVMSTAFMKAKKEMKDIQLCLQNLRKQMDNFHGNFDDISLPDLPKAVADSLSPDSIGVQRKAVTD